MTQSQINEAYQAYQDALKLWQEADEAYTSACKVASALSVELDACERQCTMFLKRYQGYVQALSAQTMGEQP